MRDALSLSHFRRRVADNYARARAAGAGAEAWNTWRAHRDALFASHPQSPVPESARAAFRGMRFFPYDPSWRIAAVVEPISTDVRGASPVPDAPPGSGAPLSGVSSPDGEFRFIGTAVAIRGDEEIRLPLLWLDAYGGGLFLPFRDVTNGEETYGGGRYLLDQAKGADLGATDDGRLVLDFNYAYHPSCAHDPRWTCPLAPIDSVVPMPVRAGEMAP
jgi:uncharacterized protein (DUF1684 family)